MKGTVKFFNQMKGFGFIAAEDGKEYFVHMTGVVGGAKLHDGDKVTFNVVSGDKGPKADQVALDKDGAAAPAADESSGESSDESSDESDDSDETEES